MKADGAGSPAEHGPGARVLAARAIEIPTGKAGWGVVPKGGNAAAAWMESGRGSFFPTEPRICLEQAGACRELIGLYGE